MFGNLSWLLEPVSNYSDCMTLKWPWNSFSSDWFFRFTQVRSWTLIPTSLSVIIWTGPSVLLCLMHLNFTLGMTLVEKEIWMKYPCGRCDWILSLKCHDMSDMCCTHSRMCCYNTCVMVVTTVWHTILFLSVNDLIMCLYHTTHYK